MHGRALFALLSLLLVTVAVDAQQVRLRVNLQTAATHPYYGVSVVRFKEEVERRSKGTIAMQLFDESQLFHDEEVVGALASGAVDIGITSAHNFAVKVPAVAILDQPFLLNYEALVRAAVSPDSELRALIDEVILAKLGVRILWWQSLGDNLIFSKGRDVADPERINGQRVGTPGFTLASSSRGAAPTPARCPWAAFTGPPRTALWTWFW